MTRVLLTKLGAGDTGDRSGDYHGASLALGRMLRNKIEALWLLGNDHARGDVYDYANNGHPLNRHTGAADVDHAVVSGDGYYQTGIFPQDVAAGNADGFCGMLVVVNAGWNDLGTGDGRTFMSNFDNTLAASVGFGIGSTSNHFLTATMRGPSGTALDATLVHDALNGTRYELYYAGFKPGETVLLRRVRRDDGSILRAAARRTGDTAIVPGGARVLDIGRAANWLIGSDMALAAVLKAPLSDSEMDEAFDRISALLDDTVGLAL